MVVTNKLGVRLAGSATLAASSQGEDRWRAAQEGGHSGVGGVAGHFSKKREEVAHPQLFQAMLKNKSTL